MRSLDRVVSSLAFVSVQLTRHPRAFLGACLIVIAWAFTGPLFGFSDTWQLVINTGTTIVTFLLGFLTQHALSLSADEHRGRVEASLDKGHDHRDRLEQKVDHVLESLGCNLAYDTDAQERVCTSPWTHR